MQAGVRMCLRLQSILFLPLAAAKDFCNVQGKYITELPNAINQQNKEASGLTLNAARTHFFTISDSPDGNALIFSSTIGAKSAATIKITGIANINFNGGYGDWESVVTKSCSAKPSSRCIVVGDIGHNKVRNKGGTIRTSAQSVRFIEVEEPTASELDAGGVLEKAGKEYSFKYPGGRRFDAEAMVVKSNRLFVITKNSKSYPYSHMFEVPNMKDGMQLVEKAIFSVQYSEVTGATASPGYLILRTYIGLNFYKWDALCDSTVRTSKVYQTIPYLERNHGLQEAIEFDATSGYLYLAGEGRTSLYRMTCTPARAQTLSPAFTSKCLDDYGGKASQTSQASGSNRLFPCAQVLIVMLSMLVVAFR